MKDPSARVVEAMPESVEQTPPEYHRAVFRYFQDHSSEVATVDELSAFVCDQNQAAPDDERVKIRLHHSTLPKLAETELLDYDPRSNTARFHGSLPGKA